jgi:hypothetical protein
MTQLTLPQAAKATGKDRTTLFRAIKAGKLSASKNHAGDYQVDVAELIRVYGPLKGATLRNDASQAAPQPGTTAETINDNNGLLREAEFLRAQVASLEADKADLRVDRDKWRQAYEDKSAEVKQLTDQRPAGGGKGLLSKLFGG